MGIGDAGIEGCLEQGLALGNCEGATGGDYIGLVQQKPPANHAFSGAGAADAASCAAALCGGAQVRSRRAFVTTNTMESALAAAPSTGASTRPNAGSHTPPPPGTRTPRQPTP